MRLIFTISLFSLAICGFSQDYEMFYSKSQMINRGGMYVLGGWAITNIVSGAIGWKYSTGDTRYFHQMNLFWNTVNLTIAGFGLAHTFSTEFHSMTGPEMLDKHLGSERLFLINAGLDLLYIGGGYYMKYRSTVKEKNKDLLSGYGKSIMMQGGFLLVFDMVMYLIQRHHRIQFLESANLDLSMWPGALSLVHNF